MRWWFGRKSAAPDARPFVPAWLTSAGTSESFARSAEGMSVYVRDTQTFATYAGSKWMIGVLHGAALHVDGEQVVGPRMAAIIDPVGGSQIDTEARLAVGAILTALRSHGLIAD